MAVKKSIAIIGEGETEWFYFDSLRIACRYPFKVAPDFPQHSDIPHMAKLAESYVKCETDYVICLVDMDRLLQNPKEKETYSKIRKKSSRKIMWVETNPCTEFWFLLHFLPQLSVKHYDCYEQLIPELQRAWLRKDRKIFPQEQALQLSHGKRRPSAGSKLRQGTLPAKQGYARR